MAEECCPDVCDSIEKMKKDAKDELDFLILYRDDMKAVLEKIGIRTYKGSRTQKQEDYIKERLNGLNDLEKILEINKICKCD